VYYLHRESSLVNYAIRKLRILPDTQSSNIKRYETVLECIFVCGVFYRIVCEGRNFSHGDPVEVRDDEILISYFSSGGFSYKLANSIGGRVNIGLFVYILFEYMYKAHMHCLIYMDSICETFWETFRFGVGLQESRIKVWDNRKVCQCHVVTDSHNIFLLQRNRYEIPPRISKAKTHRRNYSGVVSKTSAGRSPEVGKLF